MATPTHRCPGGCGQQVTNRMFACGTCWARLPRDLQTAIYDTAHLTLLRPERMDAVLAAVEWYAANTKEHA